MSMIAASYLVNWLFALGSMVLKKPPIGSHAWHSWMPPKRKLNPAREFQRGVWGRVQRATSTASTGLAIVSSFHSPRRA